MHSETPILNQLILHTRNSRLPLHVPGHKGGRILPDAFKEWMALAAQLDLTELPGLDNLMQPSGCILESQTYTAELYGSDECLYSVNGSTACVMASLLGTLSPGDKIVLCGPVHESVWRGLVLADALPVFLPTDFDFDTLLFHPPGYSSFAVLRSLLANDPAIKAVFVTSPNYQGLAADVESLAEISHAFKLPLIVDEAHGAHFGFAPGLPQHSVAAGADVVVHSVHKMLPALTQTAWMHIQGGLVDYNRLQSSLRLLQSTSPSYLLLASIDAASAWLRLEGPQVMRRSTKVLEMLPQMLPQMTSRVVPRMFPKVPAGEFDVFEDTPRDMFRHWVPTGDEAVGTIILQHLEHNGIHVEYADACGVLSIFGLEVEEQDVVLYCDVLREAVSIARQNMATEFNFDTRSHVRDNLWRDLVHLMRETASAAVVASPRECTFRNSRLVPLHEAHGYLAAEPIAPYPPGTPVVWPGQKLTPEVCGLLGQLWQSSPMVRGISKDGFVTVIA